MTPQDTLTKLISAIVEPNLATDFRIDQAESPISGITQLNISAPSTTIGQIIGKQGKIIKSLRILMAIAYPNQKFNIQIEEA